MLHRVEGGGLSKVLAEHKGLARGQLHLHVPGTPGGGMFGVAVSIWLVVTFLGSQGRRGSCARPKFSGREFSSVQVLLDPFHPGLPMATRLQPGCGSGWLQCPAAAFWLCLVAQRDRGEGKDWRQIISPLAHLGSGFPVCRDGSGAASPATPQVSKVLGAAPHCQFSAGYVAGTCPLASRPAARLLGPSAGAAPGP